MIFDLETLKKSVGKRLKFRVKYYVNKSSDTFTDIFYAIVRDIDKDCIIVEQYYVKVDENFEETIISQKRKLKKGNFEIDSEIPLNG